MTEFVWIFANCAALQPFSLVTMSIFTLTAIHYFQLDVRFHPHTCIRTKMFMNFCIAVEQLVKRARSWSQRIVCLTRGTLCCVSYLSLNQFHTVFLASLCLDSLYLWCQWSVFDWVDQKTSGLQFELLFLKVKMNSINLWENRQATFVVNSHLSDSYVLKWFLGHLLLGQ